MHQKYSVSKTIQMKSEGKERILWGHIQRSGKSYIIGGSIIIGLMMSNPEQSIIDLFK